VSQLLGINYIGRCIHAVENEDHELEQHLYYLTKECTMDKLWLYAMKPIWSFIINVLYWIFHIFKLRSVLKEKQYIKNTTISIISLKHQLERTSWVQDNFKDWTPWVITFISRNYKDDCDMSHTFGKFLFDCIGIKSKKLSLRGDSGGHAVCVSKDDRWMITNSHLIDLKEANQHVLQYFNGKYDRII